MLCLRVCMCIPCLLNAHRGLKRASEPWNYSYRWLWATIRVLGVNGPLREQRELLTADPSLRPWSPVLYFNPHHYTTPLFKTLHLWLSCILSVLFLQHTLARSSVYIPLSALKCGWCVTSVHMCRRQRSHCVQELCSVPVPSNIYMGGAGESHSLWVWS